MPGQNPNRPRDARKTGQRAAGRRPHPQGRPPGQEGYAGNVPPHGGNAPHTVVYGVAPPEKKRGWMKTVMSGALIATGSIIAYKVYNKIRGKDDETPAVPPGAAAVNPAPMAAAPTMAAPFAPQPYAAYPMAGLSALGQPPSPTLNAALAMQNMIAQQQMAAVQARAAEERRRPKLNPPKQAEPELSYMDEYLQQFDDE